MPKARVTILSAHTVKVGPEIVAKAVEAHRAGISCVKVAMISEYCEAFFQIKWIN